MDTHLSLKGYCFSEIESLGKVTAVAAGWIEPDGTFKAESFILFSSNDKLQTEHYAIEGPVFSDTLIPIRESGVDWYATRSAEHAEETAAGITKQRIRQIFHQNPANAKSPSPDLEKAGQDIATCLKTLSLMELKAIRDAVLKHSESHKLRQQFKKP